MPRGYIGLEQAAQWVGRSPRTIQRWVQSGSVDSRRDPHDQRRLLVSLTDVEAVASGLPLTELEAEELARAKSGDVRRTASSVIWRSSALRVTTWP